MGNKDQLPQWTPAEMSAFEAGWRARNDRAREVSQATNLTELDSILTGEWKKWLWRKYGTRT